MNRYQGVVEVVKLCGRTLGVEFLQGVIDAYLRGSFAGNLLALADTTAWLAEQMYIANESLPDDFFARTTTCHRDCRACGYCAEALRASVKRQPLRLKDWRRQGNLQ